jgi:anti-anti-sigma factor
MPFASFGTSYDGGCLVLHPAGALDIARTPSLRADLDELFAEPGRHVVVDLSGVDFIDCAAIGALMSGRDRAARTGGSLRALGATPRVRHILELTGVAKALETAPDGAQEAERIIVAGSGNRPHTVPSGEDPTMSQPEESRAKTTETDAVLMHPHEDPDVTIAQVPGPAETGETRVEIDGEMIRVRADRPAGEE